MRNSLSIVRDPGTQLRIFLPERNTDEILAERLADRIEQFNATTDPAERIELHHEIRRLRSILNMEAGRP